MTRPKVDPEKRQRTANACDSCKRRKQKCDGNQPCSTCAKKQFTCTYTAEQNQYGYSPSSQSSTKRVRSNGGSYSEAGTPLGSYTSLNGTHGLNAYAPTSHTPSMGEGTRGINIIPPRAEPKSETKIPSDQGSSGGEDEVDNHTMTRMLEDSSGRLIYIGDASSLSFLQLLRMIVETVAGPTPFSLDPGRHSITEAKLSLSPNTHMTHLLPKKQTALILVDSFFTNTFGLIQVFDEKGFLADLDRCYSDPLTLDNIYLCHLNLVLAIGLSFATPEVGTSEAAIIDTLRSTYPEQSEVFFSNAKSLNNPVNGLEDGDLWSIQALLLMAMYMLTKSMRNPAFSYIGMAVRTAYALGMHREETLAIFPEDEQESRIRIWRSLFIMDRFIAASLGRPVAIAEEECSSEVFDPKTNRFSDSTHLSGGQLCTAGLEAATRSCHVVGLILRKVYLKRRISTRLAQELADECKRWPENLSPALHWRQASPNNRRQAIAILHSNLVYCHSIILLSRPFFLYLLSAEVKRKHFGCDQDLHRSRGRMTKFSEACIISSMHTIALVQTAYMGRYLPQLNPFVTYNLFAAALIIFANEFTRPSSNDLTNQCIANSISIMSYCGEMDPQAKRAAYVLVEFRNVIRKQRNPSAFQLQHLPAFQTSLPAMAPLTSGMENTGMDLPPLEGGFAPIPPLPGATAASSDTSRAAPINPFTSTDLPATPSLPMEDSFSGLLDLTNTVLPNSSEFDSPSLGEEPIDFDKLWGPWPGLMPSSNVGTPAMPG